MVFSYIKTYLMRLKNYGYDNGNSFASWIFFSIEMPNAPK